MALLSATNLHHAYGDDVVLDGASLSVDAAERIGVVGRNGTGKSTLLKAIAGQLRPDEGQVSLRRGARLSVLEQEASFPPASSVREAARQAFGELSDLHRRLHDLFEEMSASQGPHLERLLGRQAELERQIEAAGGYAIDHRIDAVLHGLGFTDAQFSLPVAALSGGQRARLALAKVLLEEPDLVLLDEPTNHLDLSGRLWLERFLASEFKGAIVMISHDRYLLDAVVDRIVEVEQGRLIEYPGNYSTFRELRAERREAMARAWANQQQQFRREEQFIRKYKAGQRAKQARGRESRLKRARAESTLERPLELDAFRMSLPRAERSGDLVVVARGVRKAYPSDDGGELVLFDGLSVTISRGERWGIVGPNGAGKTTLVKVLLGQIASDAGTVSLGTRLHLGFFAQTSEQMDLDVPVFRYLQRQIQRENPHLMLSEQDARDLAGAFLFSGQDQEKELSVLSGGERSRARLAALLASAKNVLVLDEPTNHLDIPSAERLEEALSPAGGFEGTLLLISHDRALIDAVCDHLLIFDGAGGVRVFHGNWNEWAERERREGEAGVDARPAPTAPPPRPAEGNGAHGAGPGKAAAPRARSRHSWMPTERLEQEITRREGQISRLDEAMNDAEFWSDAVAAAQATDHRNELKAELDELEEEWLRRME